MNSLSPERKRMMDYLPVHTIDDTSNHRHSDDLSMLAYALDTGLTGTSPVVDRYEEHLKLQYNTAYALAVSSGAAAVGVALKALDWKPGDEVIVAPSSPICTIFPLLMHGLRPIFCDVTPNSFGLAPEEVVAALTPRTKAIIEVPMWGYPTRTDRLQVLAASHGLPLILDLAHSHMVKLNGHWLAQYGDIACFSTHEGKLMSTGEGGFVLSHRAEHDARMRAYTRFGNLDGQTFGVNFKLNGLHAAVGIARLEALERQVTIRQRNRNAILSRLHNPHVRELPIPCCGTVSGYALLLQTIASDGRQFVEHLVSHGIPSDIHKYDNQPLYNYPVLADYRRDCPHVAALLRSLTTIPLHPDLSPEDLAHIVKVINAYEP
ncbi:DegT/DnrJ/EryC1/StrS family aminotransferase [Chitinivorax sp. B]|uniref:DegT/DnrJ/EryC1/StrS family aminotransferase n=1 Tax=Chitinivorax sp. B TaxID=2502235 RepID=UPI00201824F6|nr:DegT/DnrJ/EryC1/StrS family aminotransferase [Chitinivorax sp. B]